METKKTKNVYSLADIKKMAQDVKSGVMLSNSLPADVINAVNITVEAYNYLEEKLPLKYLTERLRTNTVGDLVTDISGTPFVAMNRGAPRGWVAGVSDGANVYIGTSYPAEDEKFIIPQVGAYLALKRAITNMEAKNPGKAELVHQADKRQVSHFYKRALAYFMPEKFSFSRGTEPVHYFDEELHKRQEMVGFKYKPSKKYREN